MRIVNIHEAKTQLSKLIKDVSDGHYFIIGKAGIPVAKLIPYKTGKKLRKGGQLKDKITIKDNFDALPDIFISHFSK